jgi:transposase InsO family protein
VVRRILAARYQPEPDEDVVRRILAARYQPEPDEDVVRRILAARYQPEPDEDVVRRILAARYQPEPDSAGPSWLTFLGHMKDNLWSLDLFRCESATLLTHWVLVVMDQFTRRIVGFGVHGGIVDGVALCRMFSRAIRGQSLPKYPSSDHDPLYRFHQWKANLRVLEVTEITGARRNRDLTQVAQLQVSGHIDGSTIVADSFKRQ